MTTPSTSRLLVLPTLLLDAGTLSSWNAKKGALTGAFKGTHAQDAVAYVAVPSSWRFDSGKAGGRRIKSNGDATLIAFAAPAGKRTDFTLKFARR